MKVFKKNTYFEKRCNPRQPYLGLIFFATANGYFEGRIKNFSRYGLFIETRLSLAAGDVISIPLPRLNRKHVKCKGQIRWCNKEGYGIKILMPHRGADLRIIK